MGGDTSVKTDIGQIYFYTKKLYIFRDIKIVAKHIKLK
jgi:hypothetical protein